MNKKTRAPRNKTLTLTDEERISLEKNLFLSTDVDFSLHNILNKIILGDTLTVLDLLPNKFADLIILDPPYNLSRDFHGFKFAAINNEDYLAYLRSWFPKVVQKLKPNGSLYLCGDWKCTSA